MFNILLFFFLLPLEKDTLFAGDGTWGPYVLSPFLLKNSVDVTLNDSSAHYSVSYDRGILFFNHPITERDTVRCKYMTLPFSLENQYYRWSESEDTVEVEEKATYTEKDDKQQVRFGGEKRFSISLGNRKDFSIDQSTRLCMEGKISGDLRIEGELSDENLPMNPEGITQEITDFEKAYLKVGNDNVSLLLGDTDLSFNAARDHRQPIERKVEGISGKLIKDNFSCDATVSLAKGNRKKLRLKGKAGKQGPYVLSREKPVVSGSERVYVDGRELKREKDYMIDYPIGQVFFKSSFPITGGEDILFYFEEADGDYRREIYEFEAAVTGDFSFGFGLFRESDNGKHPTTIVLSELDREIISSSSDSVVWLPGGRYVGENNGDYLLRDSVYVFIGYDEGDWDVKFTEKEEGDYEYNNSLGGYEFVGKGNGDYVPYVRIPLPRAYTLSKVSLGKRFGNSTISIDGLFSLNDVNSLKKEDEIWGGSGNLSYITRGDNYDLEARLWSSSEDYHCPDVQEEWGRGYGVKLGLNPHRLILLNGYLEGGNLRRGNLNLRLGSDRKGIECRWNRDIRFTERFLKGYYGVKYLLPYLYIGDIEREFLKSNVYGAGLERDKFTFEIYEETRDTLSCRWERFQKTKNANLRFYPGNVDINFTYKKGEKRNEDYSLLLGSFNGLIKSEYANLHFDYDLSRTEKTLYEEFYHEVEEGEGSYSRDPSTGRYYPNDYGNYDRRLIPRSSPELINQFHFQHIVNIFPFADAKLTIKTIKSGEGSRISFWSETSGITDKNHISVATSLKKGLFTGYYSRLDVRDGRTLGNTRQRSTTMLEGGLNPSIYGSPIFLDYRQEESLESYIDGEVIGKDIMREVSGRIDGFIKNSKVSLTTTFGEQKIRDFIYSFSNPYVRFLFLKLAPNFRYRGDTKELLVNLEVTNRRTIEGKASCATRSIYPPGLSYLIGLSLTLKPKGNIHYVLDYQGRKREEYPLDHVVKVEAKMLF